MPLHASIKHLFALFAIATSIVQCQASAPTASCSPATISAMQHPNSKTSIRLRIADDVDTATTLFPAIVTLCLVATSDITSAPSSTFVSSAPSQLPTALPTVSAVTKMPTKRPTSQPSQSPTKRMLGCPNTDLDHMNCASDWQTANPGQQITQRQCYDLGCCFDPRNTPLCFPRLPTVSPNLSPTIDPLNVSALSFSNFEDEEEEYEYEEVILPTRMLAETNVWEFDSVACSSMRNVTADSDLDITVSPGIPAGYYSIVLNFGAACLPTEFQTEVVGFTQCNSSNTMYPVIVPAEVCVAQYTDHCIDRDQMADTCRVCATSDECITNYTRFNLNNEPICVFDSPECTSSALSSGAIIESNTTSMASPIGSLSECVTGNLWNFPSVGMIDPTCIAQCTPGFEYNSDRDLCVPKKINCLEDFKFDYANSCLVEPDLLLIADAGSDQELTLGLLSALTLNGSVSSGDGIIAYEWTLISQTFEANSVPLTQSDANITTPNESTTTVTNLQPGTLTFQLNVTNDEGKQDVDTVQVTILSLDAAVAPGVVGAVGVRISFVENTASLVLGSTIEFNVSTQDVADELLLLANTLNFRIIAADTKGRASSTSSTNSQHAFALQFASTLSFEDHSILSWKVPFNMDISTRYSLHVVLESKTHGTLGKIAESLPLAVIDPFELTVSNWGECSAAAWQCGGGTKERSATCSNTHFPDDSVALSVCVNRGLTVPELVKDCWSGPCNGISGNNYFALGEWGTCSQECAGGVQTRTAQCLQSVDDDATKVCPANSILGQLRTTPAVVRPCNLHACTSTHYYVDAYTSTEDGDQQTCVCSNSGYDMPLQFCRDDANMVPVLLGQCSGTSQHLEHTIYGCTSTRCSTSHAWRVGTWSTCGILQCASNTGNERTRTVECVDISTGIVETDPDTIAATCVGISPATSSPCITQSCSHFVWQAGEWGECEGEKCGPDSKRKRTISCMEYALTSSDGERVTQVDPNYPPNLEWLLVNETIVEGEDTRSTCVEAIRPNMYESCAHMPCPPCELVKNSAGSVSDGVSCTNDRTFDVMFVPSDANLTATCTSMIVDRHGTCCAGNWPAVGANGECCVSGVVDACGICDGDATVVDIFGVCCQYVDSAGQCCEVGPPDSCGVCQGHGLSCPLHVSASGDAPVSSISALSWVDAAVFGDAWVQKLMDENELASLDLDVTLAASEYDILFGSTRRRRVTDQLLSDGSQGHSIEQLQLNLKLSSIRTTKPTGSEQPQIADIGPQQLQSIKAQKFAYIEQSHENLIERRELSDVELEVILKPSGESSSGSSAGEWDAAVLDQVIARIAESPASLALLKRSGTCGNGVCELGEICFQSSGSSSCCPQDCPFLHRTCPGALEDGVTTCSGHGTCAAHSGSCICYEGQGYKGVACGECMYGWVASAQHVGVCVVAEEKVTWIQRQTVGGGEVWRGLWAEQWPVIVASIAGIIAFLLCIGLNRKFSVVSGTKEWFLQLGQLAKQQEQGGRVGVLAGLGRGKAWTSKVKLQSTRVMTSNAVVPELTAAQNVAGGGNESRGAGARMRADGAMVELEGWLKIRPISSESSSPHDNQADSDSSDDDGVVWERYYFVLFKRDKELTYFQAVSDVGDGAKVYIGEMGAVALNNLCFVRSLRHGGFKGRTFQIGTFMEIQERSFDRNITKSSAEMGGGKGSNGYKHRTSTQVKIVSHELLARTPSEKQQWVDALSFYVETPQLKMLNEREMDLPNRHEDSTQDRTEEEDDDAELLPVSELRRGTRVA